MCEWHNVADYGLDEGDTQLLRCKPEGIDELSRSTKFTRKELQTMYRGFKQVLEPLEQLELRKV